MENILNQKVGPANLELPDGRRQPKPLSQTGDYKAARHIQGNMSKTNTNRYRFGTVS